MAELFDSNGIRKENKKRFPIDEMGNKLTDPSMSTVRQAQISSRFIEPFRSFERFIRGGEIVGGEYKTYPRVREEGFDPEDFVKKNYPQYLSQTNIWMRGNNADHTESYIQSYERYLNNRKVEMASSGWQQFFGELQDPTNYIPLKIVTSPIGFGSKFGKRFSTNVGIGSAFVYGQNLGRTIDDETYSLTESAANAAFAGGFIGVIGEGLNKINKNAFNKSILKSMNDINNNAAQLVGKTKEELNVNNPDKRKLGKLTDEQLISEKTKIFEALKKGDGEKLVKNLDAIDEEIGIRKVEQNESDFDIAPSLYTDSFLYNMISNPLKRISRGGLLKAQEFAYKLAFDSGVLLKAHKKGNTLEPSVHSLNKLHDGKLKGFADEFIKLWGRDKEGGSQTFLDLNMTSLGDTINRNTNTFDNWLNTVAKHYIDNTLDKTTLTKSQTDGIKKVDEFFTEWRSRLEDSGQIKTATNLRNQEILYIQKRTQFNNTKNLNKFQRNILNDELKRIDKKLNRIQFELKKIKEPEETLGTAGKYPIQLDDAFFPRYWDRNAILKNKTVFKEILRTYMLENPNTLPAKPQKKGMALAESGEAARQPTTEANVDARVNAVVNDILTNQQNDEFFGHGITKHLNKRKIAIPNKLVVDFIETNPLTVMKAYNQKTAPVYEFRKQHGNLAFDDAIDELRFNLRMDGASEKKINAAIRDITHLYESVTHNILRNPDAWNHKIVAGLKNFAQLNYLGSAGFTTITEPAKIIMEHGFGTTFRALKSVLDEPTHWASRAEAQKAGEALDLFLGSASQRISDAQSANPLENNIWDKGKNAFYILNGLTFATRMLKDFDAVVRQHSLMEMAIKLSKKEASSMEIDYLARYGINKDDAIELAKMPYQTTKNNFIMANTDAWKNPQIKTKFQLALSNGILNTILMGTPADKPIVMSGIFYVPMRVARQFGMAEDVKVKGYARIENSMLSMPFQFYSYMMASVNKTAAGYAHGQIKGKASGLLAALGLGYMLLRIKTSDRTFENMSNRDKFFRSFDYAGITAIYNDMLYTALHTVGELSGKNITGGLVSPKYNIGKASKLESIVGAFGAGPSIGFDLMSGVTDLLKGNFSQGAATILRNLPFTQLWMIKDTTNDIARNWTGRY